MPAAISSRTNSAARRVRRAASGWRCCAPPSRVNRTSRSTTCELGRAGAVIHHRHGPEMPCAQCLPGAVQFYLIGADNVPRTVTPGTGSTSCASWSPSSSSAAATAGRAGAGWRSRSFARWNRVLDLSSTEIRNRVASGQSIRYLVPGDRGRVIIDAHGLYRNQPAAEGAPSLPPKK